MLETIKNLIIKFKKWIAVIVAIFTTWGVASLINPTPIPEHLQLKATPERILNSRVVLQEKCVKWEEITNGTSTQICKQSEYENIVKYLYASDIKVPQEEGEDISKRAKNAQIFPQGRNEKSEEKFIGRFYVGEPFYQENDIWYQMEEATTTLDAFNKQIGFNSILENTVFALTTTTYSGAGDGRVYATEASWDATHDAVSGVASHTETEYIAAYSTETLIYRGFFPFDTSGLPDNANISDTKFYFYVYEITDAVNEELDLVQTFQASNTTLENADYEDCGSDDPQQGGRAKYIPVEGADPLDITALTINQYHYFTLNATGRGWVSKTDWTKLGTRINTDTNDNDPGVLVDAVRIRFSEYADTTSDPYLEITYTVPSAERRTIQTQFIE